MNRDEEKIKAAADYIAERGYKTGQLDVAFIEGIEWADEHPNLTWKDIKKIYHLVNEVSDDLGVRAMYVNIFQEALKRFIELKHAK